MVYTIKVLDICMCWDDVVDLHTGSSNLQNHLYVSLPVLCPDFPGKS